MAQSSKSSSERTSVVTVDERLTRYIQDSDLSVHDRLPAERALALQLGCSRGTLRATLDRWQRAGRIWRHVGQGTFLGAHPPSSRAPVTVSLDITTPGELMQSRLVIEPAVAALAARVGSVRSIRTMRDYALQTCIAEDWQAYERSDNAFHKAVAAATENRVLISLMEIVSAVRVRVAWQREHDQIFRRAHKKEYAANQGSVHVRIVDAIEAGDEKRAFAEMHEHLIALAALAADGSASGTTGK